MIEHSIIAVQLDCPAELVVGLVILFHFVVNHPHRIVGGREVLVDA